jgi:hypothetical protein
MTHERRWSGSVTVLPDAMQQLAEEMTRLAHDSGATVGVRGRFVETRLDVSRSSSVASTRSAGKVQNVR